MGLDPRTVLNSKALSEPHQVHPTQQQREEDDKRLLTELSWTRSSNK